MSFTIRIYLIVFCVFVCFWLTYVARCVRRVWWWWCEIIVLYEVYVVVVIEILVIYSNHVDVVIKILFIYNKYVVVVIEILVIYSNYVVSKISQFCFWKWGVGEPKPINFASDTFSEKSINLWWNSEKSVNVVSQNERFGGIKIGQLCFSKWGFWGMKISTFRNELWPNEELPDGVDEIQWN